jgi:hypothetical protein
MGYGLDGRDSFHGRGKSFSSLFSIQTDPGAHPAFYPMDNGSSFPGGKAAGA